MLRLWRMAYPGMGAGHLPDSGGVMDQAAVMLDAFSIMNAARGEVEVTDADRDGGDRP